MGNGDAVRFTADVAGFEPGRAMVIASQWVSLGQGSWVALFWLQDK